tara:strand:- start:531 stop:1295 length:765 start_codon:yes stop_codon:yes gene_type:complete
MKFLLSLSLIFSFMVIADDHETPEYKYEVEANKAEYYIGNFNSNKDIDDLVAWYGKFAKWAEGKGDTYNEMTVALLQPYFHSDMSSADVMWVNTWPSPSSQFNAMQTWITEGGPKLLESLPVTNSRQVDTWQWTISQPSSMAAGNMMYATYADCSIEEGYDARQVYDMYKDFAIYAQSQGDTLGRKMIVPDAGYQLPDGVDFIRLMYSSSISERGTNAELYYSKIGDSEAAANLKGFSCTNARSYFGLSMRSPS